MFKILSKEEIMAKEILSNLKDLKENIKMKKFCVLSNNSVYSVICDHKEEAVELLRMGIDFEWVKNNVIKKIDALLNHNCHCCGRSEYDMEHDRNEYYDTTEILNDIKNEYDDYENIEFDDDDY